MEEEVSNLHCHIFKGYVKNAIIHKCPPLFDCQIQGGQAVSVYAINAATAAAMALESHDMTMRLWPSGKRTVTVRQTDAKKKAKALAFEVENNHGLTYSAVVTA